MSLNMLARGKTKQCQGFFKHYGDSALKTRSVTFLAEFRSSRVSSPPPPQQQQRLRQRQTGQEAADMGEDGDAQAARLEGEADQDLQGHPGAAEPERVQEGRDAGMRDLHLVAAEQQSVGAEQGRDGG